MAGSTFDYLAPFAVTKVMKDAYVGNGFVLIRNLLNKEEVSKVRSAVENSEGIRKYSYGRSDGRSRKTKVCLWNHPGNDVTGVMARMERVAGTAQQLMDVGEIYHYHSKLIMKDAGVGGAHLWHQDYGYWYFNGCLMPNMSSVFIPIDDCTKDNGCLQVIRGSHKLGRLDHDLVGDQRTAQKERVDQALSVLDHIYIDMSAGDALFFHCNLLHTSDQNSSPHRRWAFITAFNAKGNDPVLDHYHPSYIPLEMVKDSALLECDVMEDLEGKSFLDLRSDMTTNNGIARH